MWQIYAPWLIEFTGAFLGAAFSFGALIGWEKWREHHADRRAIAAAKDELQVNQLHNNANREVLQDDIEAQKERKTSLQNLILLSSDEMRYALIRLHKRPSSDKLSFNVRQIIHLVEMVNQKINYRETYRVHKEGMDNYDRRMPLLDTIVLQAVNHLKEEMKKVIPMLVAESKGRPETK